VPVAPGGDDVPDDEVLVVVVVGGVAVEDNVDAVGAGELVTVDRPLTTKPSPVGEVEVEEVVVTVRVGIIVGEVVVAVRVGVIVGELVVVDVPSTELAPGSEVVVGMPEVAVDVAGIVDVT